MSCSNLAFVGYCNADQFTWIESNRIIWAITDADGNPVEMPQNRIDQVWETWGKKEKKHFDFKECADLNNLNARYARISDQTAY